MKILCCQLSIDDVITPHAASVHQTRVEHLIRQACDREAVDLVLLPELSAIEYSDSAFENLADLACELQEWLLDAMASLARELSVAICFGMPRVEDGRYYITQVTLNAAGVVISSYDKVHIAHFGASSEKKFFGAGNHISVFELHNFRFGVVICYDMRFGEFITSVVRDGDVDAVLHPVAFSQDGSFASWHSFVCTRALEHQVYWCSINRAGSGWGHSIVCPPWYEHDSEVMTFSESESLRVVELDKGRLLQARQTFPLSVDRLESYADIKLAHYVDDDRTC